MCAALSCSAFFAGCHSDTDITRRPPAGPGIAPYMQVEPSAAQPQQQQPTSQPNLVFGHPAALAEPPSAAPAAAQTAPADKPNRDYPSELLAMIGDPLTCLTPRAVETPNVIYIAIDTQVMPSGATGRSQVAAAGLSSDEQRCLTRRVDSLRFGGTIENAPFPVRASLTIRTQPPKDAHPKPSPDQLASAQQLPPSAADKEPTPFLQADPEPRPIPDPPPAAAPTERPGFMQPDPEPPAIPNGPPIQGADDSTF
ncbi:MAG: hypothetical protein ABW321_30700 [Polyangiales bacterium]